MQLYPGRFMLELDTWETPATRYPRKKVGAARIVTRFAEPAFYDMYGVKAPDGEQYQHYEAVERLKITTLRIGRDTWMVDDPPHWYGTCETAAACRGHVLCAGLGLGLIVHALRRNPEVTKVTVVERSPDVIDLVWPHLAPAGRPEDGKLLTVWRGDWWRVQPEVLADLVGPVDTVFFDLLVGHGPDLVGSAASAVADMRRRWPGVPNHVFGMNAAVLNEMFDEAELASARTANRLAAGREIERAGLTEQKLVSELSREPEPHKVSDAPTQHANAPEPGRRPDRRHAGRRTGGPR